jgi:hypothetical protein
VEDARSARVGPRRGESPADFDWAGLVRYYAAAAASESASETGFRFHREGEGSRFIFYSGADPLFGVRGGGGPEQLAPLGLGQPGYSEPNELNRLLYRTARLGAEKLFYGYPLVITDATEILPVLFATWPVVAGDVQVNPALLPADPDRRRMIWRKLKALQRDLAEGSEPAPGKAQAFGAALKQLVEALGLRPAESLLPGNPSDLNLANLSHAASTYAAAPVSPVSSAASVSSPSPASPGVYNRSILFRGKSPRLPLWLWEDWQHLLERPAALGEVLGGNQGQDQGEGSGAREASGEEMARGCARCRLLFSPLSPAERQRLEQALSVASGRSGWDYVDVPAGDQLVESAFNLILNGWYAGMRVLVLVPDEAEARQIHERVASITSLPTVAIWGSAAQRQQTRADLHWVLRRRRHRALPPNETRVQTAEVQLESAWLELRRQEEMVEHAAEAGERLAALGKELDEAAAGIPSSLLALVEREARRANGGPVQAPGSAASGFDGLGKEVEGFMLEAERVAAGRWHWSERLWPWQRRRRALARLEVQVRSLLHGAGLNSGDWFAAPLPGDAEGMLKSLRLLRAALNYADLLGRYKQLEQQAGAGAWDAPEGLPSRLAERWAALATAAGTAARARRDWELDSLPEQAVDQLELLLQLQAELAVAAPGSPAEQELEWAFGDSFVAALEALPVWIVPLAGASEPLPQRPALFDLLVVVGAERIPLAAMLPFAARATSVVMVGDARSEAEALGEWTFERWGSKSEKQELASTCGLRGLDYVLRGWPVASLRWLRQKRVGAAAGSAATGPGRYLRYRSFPLGQLLSRLYFGESLMPAGPPAGGFTARTGISALRWDVTRGEMGSPDSGSAFNLDEAEAVVGLLGKWLDALHRQAMESAELKPLTIAVVTLFGRQRELLLHKLAALLPDGYEELAEVSVLRVDELAGRRFDVVLASTVLAGEYPAAHQAYLAQHPEFVYALLAAARLSLTVVGDPTAIRTLGGVWSELVDALVKVNAPDSVNGIASVNAVGRPSAGPGRHPGRQPEGQKAGAAAAATAAAVASASVEAAVTVLAAGAGMPMTDVGSGAGVDVTARVAAAATDQGQDQNRGKVHDQDKDTGKGQVAVPAEDLPTPNSFTVKGPYPPGSQGVNLVYQELFLMQNGWRGQRLICTITDYLPQIVWRTAIRR